jgi:hypothetical protein
MRWSVAFTILTIVAGTNDSHYLSESCPQSQCEETPSKTDTQTQNPTGAPLDGYHVIVFDEHHRYEGYLMSGRYHGHGVDVTKEGTYDGKKMDQITVTGRR